MTQEQKINEVIANGCPHRWQPIWWKGGTWLRRGDHEQAGRPGDVDPKVSMIIQQNYEKKFRDAGYRRAYRCALNCGLAYLAKDQVVVQVRDEGV